MEFIAEIKTKEDFVKKAVELEAERIIYNAYLKIYAQPGYLGSQVRIMMNCMTVREALGKVYEEINELFENHRELSESITKEEAQEMSKKYALTRDEEHKITKSRVGFPIAIEELAHKL